MLKALSIAALLSYLILNLADSYWASCFCNLKAYVVYNIHTLNHEYLDASIGYTIFGFFLIEGQGYACLLTRSVMAGRSSELNTKIQGPSLLVISFIV